MSCVRAEYCPVKLQPGIIYFRNVLTAEELSYVPDILAETIVCDLSGFSTARLLDRSADHLIVLLN